MLAECHVVGALGRFSLSANRYISVFYLNNFQPVHRLVLINIESFWVIMVTFENWHKDTKYQNAIL